MTRSDRETDPTLSADVCRLWQAVRYRAYIQGAMARGQAEGLYLFDSDIKARPGNKQGLTEWLAAPRPRASTSWIRYTDQWLLDAYIKQDAVEDTNAESALVEQLACELAEWMVGVQLDPGLGLAHTDALVLAQKSLAFFRKVC